MAFTFQPIPVNHVAEAMAEGGNPPGVPSIKHQCKLAVYVSALAMGLQKLIPDAWTTLVDWQNAKDDVGVRAAPFNTSEKWKELVDKRDSYIPFLFMNDASRDRNPLASYGSTDVEKLKAVSRSTTRPNSSDLAAWRVSTFKNTDIMNTKKLSTC